MRILPFSRWLVPGASLLLAACAATPQRATTPAVPELAPPVPVADLLTGGLGLEGLRATTPPAFADAERPTSEELRRRALWANWRGIADLAPGGGYGEVYGSLAAVPGREYHGMMKVPGARHPHRVLAQVPERFDASARCLVVTASSGSRGIYGAIALAGAWGLPRGCAVAYTDKGGGTDWIQSGTAAWHGPEGRVDAADPSGAAFVPAFGAASPPRVAWKHAHSQDNPEADWGRHVRQAAEFGLQALAAARPDEAPFTFANTRVIATGLSNGGGAVLRAAESGDEWLDGAVVAAPNAWAGEGGRALFDYTTQAALLMPCALLDARFDAVALARPGGQPAPAALQRCSSLRAAGLLAGDTVAAQAADALAQLHARGWTDASLEAGALSVAFDLWRAVAAGYAAAYTRSGADAMPCGYGYAMLDAQGQPRAASAAERAAWWSDSAGIPPGGGVMLLDALAQGTDPALPGLRCLRALWEGKGTQADALRAGVAATRAGLPREGLPLLVIHGADDGLVPEAFSGGAYARWAQARGRDVRYWRVADAQHFDAFLALPPWTGRYLPLLPYAYRALDAMWAHVVEGAALPGSAEIRPSRRAAAAAGFAPLRREDLALP
jgi:hydroxybutyrate-dimer hydrolase